MARFLIVIALVATTLGGFQPVEAGGAPTPTVQVQNPRFPLVGFQTVACPNTGICFAAGQDRIFSTADGGATWKHVRVHNGGQINQLVCLATTSCFGFESVYQGRTPREIVIQTRDGGRTWTDASTFTQTFLAAASCPTASVCYSFGAAAKFNGGPVTLYRSGDGGAHWIPVKGQPLYSVNTQTLTCPGTAICYVGGNGGIVVTGTGGRAWTKRSFPGAPTTPQFPGPQWGVDSISCVAGQRCYASTENGQIFHTDDGWRTSLRVRWGSSPSGPPQVNQITCPTASNCYAWGFSNAVATTSDAGKHWAVRAYDSPNFVRAIACPAAGTCTAVGDATTILSTSDAGLTWHSALPGTTNPLTAISCVDASTCTAVGAAGAIIGTTDGGQNWRLEASGVHQTLDAISCPTATVCYAAGGTHFEPIGGRPTPVAGGTAILRSSDGGSSWKLLAQQSIGNRQLDLAGIVCPAVDICFATSDSGSILATTDGGQTWKWESTGAYFQLRGIACPTTDRCVAVGGLDADCPDSCDTPEEGVIVVTQDSGRSWQRRFYRQSEGGTPSAGGAHLFSVSCPSPTVCFASGRNIVTQTTDGGQTWRVVKDGPIDQSGNVPSSGFAFACPTVSTCFASPGFRSISRTDDGGRTWISSPPAGKPQFGPLLGLACPVLNTCYAVGFSGTILRLTSAATGNTVAVHLLDRLPPASHIRVHPSLAQGWRLLTLPARKEEPSGGPSYGSGNGAPNVLLATRHELVALGFSLDLSAGQPVNVWTSLNGRDWQQTVLPASVFGQDSVRGAASGPSGLVAVGTRLASSIGGISRPEAWFSSDGRTWRRAASIGQSLASGEILGVTASRSGFVAVGDIITPPDEFHPYSQRMAVWQSSGGARWQLVSGTGQVFQNASASFILRTRNGLVALGTSQDPAGSGGQAVTVWNSSDGEHWRRVPQQSGAFPSGVQLQGVVAGRRRYVTWFRSFSPSGAHYPVSTSSDGLHWTLAPGIHFQYGDVTSIVPHGASFVALGERDQEPTLWASPDGVRWAPRVGQDVFGGGDTHVETAVDWQRSLVVVGTFSRPVAYDPASSACCPSVLKYAPTAWIWRGGTRNQLHPEWPKTDPKWFRLRTADLPAGFGSFGGNYPGSYGINCPLLPAHVANACPHALAALGPSLTYNLQEPYGGYPGQPVPYVSGLAILTGDTARAQAAFADAAGLAAAVDPGDSPRPEPVRSLPIGQGGELFSFKVPSRCPNGSGNGSPCPVVLQAGTDYVAVWHDGPAIGVIGVIGVPLDRAALAAQVAQKQWARAHALGF